MAKETMIVTPEHIKGNIVLTAAMADTLTWLIANAGVEMDEKAQADFVAARKLRDGEIRDLNELRSWCEKTAACIKEVTKHAYNIGRDEDLPANVAWQKQSYTYEWEGETRASGIAHGLEESGLLDIDHALDTVSVSAMAKAAGVTVEKLMDIYPERIVSRPKERVLKIK
jgi:hypothetical protein